MASTNSQITKKLLDPKKIKISSKVEQWAEDYHVGRFVLRGDNPLVKNSLWTRRERLCVTEGFGIIVRKKNPKKKDDLFLIGKLSDVEHDPLEENGTPYKKGTVKYLNRIGEEKQGAEDDLLDLDPEDYVIFGNNDKWEAELQGNKDLLDIMDANFKALVADLNRCLPRFAVKSRGEIDKKAGEEIKKMWNSYDEPIIYFTKGKENEDKWEAHDTEQWNPESRLSDYKIRDELVFSKYRRLNNIKHNTSKKEERHNSKEMDLVEDQFENPENSCLQERISFLAEFYDKFGGDSYILAFNFSDKDEIIFQTGDKFKEENTKESKKEQSSENQQTSTNEKAEEKKEEKQKETKENIRQEEKVLHKS